MKLIQGGTLADVASARRWSPSRESLQEVAPLMAKGCAGSALRPSTRHTPSRFEAHQYPARRAGEPHVTDFGLAKLAEDDSGLTMSAAILGTPAYMSPEQAAGKTKGLTTAADIYSWARFSTSCLPAGRLSMRTGHGDAATSLRTGTDSSAHSQSNGGSGPGNDLPEMPQQRSAAALRLGGNAGG